LGDLAETEPRDGDNGTKKRGAHAAPDIQGRLHAVHARRAA